VQESGRCGGCELPDCIDDPPPDCLAVLIASLREFVDPSGAFRYGVVAVMLEHQVGDAPDVDLGYHAANGRRGFA
jgi:hypothetical protein